MRLGGQLFIFKYQHKKHQYAEGYGSGNQPDILPGMHRFQHILVADATGQTKAHHHTHTIGGKGDEALGCTLNALAGLVMGINLPGQLLTHINPTGFNKINRILLAYAPVRKDAPKYLTTKEPSDECLLRHSD